MQYRYSEWDEDVIRRLLADRDLMRLFNYILLQTNGDVDEALRWMRYLQESLQIMLDDDNRRSKFLIDLLNFFKHLLNNLRG